MKEALVISFSNLTTDARVKRQIGFLKKSHFKITAACYHTEDAEIEFLKLNAPRLTIIAKIKSGLFLLARFYSKAYNLLYGQRLDLKTKYDLIVANDIEALPLAFYLKGNAKIIFDAHEYAPRHFENRLSWRIFFQGFNTFLCKKYIPQVDGMITIGEGIAHEYEKHFGVKPTIITNAPAFQSLEPQTVNPQKIKLVHQGIANPSRKLELMFELMDHLDDRFHLDLMLMEPTFKSAKKYLDHLKTLAEKNKKISFVPAKSTNELINALNQYDIGIVLIPPVNFNYKNTLPNKFFECIQARIALAIGPIPEMKKITEKFDIGVISDDFNPIRLAQKIVSLSASKIDQYKSNTRLAAQEMNAEKNETVFAKLVSSILANEQALS